MDTRRVQSGFLNVCCGLLFVLFFVSAANAQDEEYDLSKAKPYKEMVGLIGPVKTVVSTDEKGGKVVIDFNIKGNRTESASYNSGSMTDKQGFAYDEKRKTSEMKFYNSKNELFGKQVWVYNANENLVEITGYKPDGSSNVKSVFNYDRNKNLIEFIVYVGNSINRKVAWTYSDQGNLATRISYEEDKLDQKSFYDSKGHIVEEQGFKSDGSIAIKTVLIYNGQGHVIERKVVNFQDQPPDHIVHKYIYDEKGNIAIQEGSEPMGSYREAHTYEYDAVGNWTKHTRRESSNYFNKPEEKTFVTYRTITYYPDQPLK